MSLTGDFTLKQYYLQSMAKGKNGVWSLTVGPLSPGFYSYSFRVDGVITVDPRNTQLKTGRTLQDMFKVPGPGREWLDALPNVPHGEVRMVWYNSKSLKRVRRMHIYFPPGYAQSGKRYPVFYLLMGGGDHDDVWVTIGRANFILDNLIAAGKAKPMIVVMPEIFVINPGEPNYSQNSRLFSEDLFQDIIPYVEKHYRVLANPANRAIGGLSMPHIMTDAAFPHLNMFDYLLFTGNGLDDKTITQYQKQLHGALTNPANVKRVKIFMGDGVNALSFAGTKNLSEFFKRTGYKITYIQTQGIHGWPWFSLELYQGLPILFQ